MQDLLSLVDYFGTSSFWNLLALGIHLLSDKMLKKRRIGESSSQGTGQGRAAAGNPHWRSGLDQARAADGGRDRRGNSVSLTLDLEAAHL